MILHSLARYYARLSAEQDNAGNPKVPTYGFSEEKIGYVVVLDSDGLVVDVVPHLTDDKKPKPKYMSVPKVGGSDSNSVKPRFLWGNSQYLLGVTAKETKDPNRTKHCYDAFRNYHRNLLKESQDKGLCALLKFLEKWQPEMFQAASWKQEILDTNMVFKLDGMLGYIHQREAALELWKHEIEKGDISDGFCLVSGKQTKIAEKHPVIKKVNGGKAEKMIVSFNKESFTSFGKDQGANAPVSKHAAFAYTTALNYLLRSDTHRLNIGDTSTVFWAEAADNAQAAAVEDFFAGMMNPPDDAQENQKIFDIIEQIAKGRPLQEIAPDLATDTRFYILGLAPNVARISVRFWLDTTFGQLAANLAQHWQDLQLEPCPWKNPPSVWRLLVQTAVLGKSENISPVLAGEMTRAIIGGTPYPMNLLSQLIVRIRADGDANGLRVAMMKAVLQRKFRKGLINEGVDMSLNVESHNQAYLLGRLFAVLERIQNQALGDLNAGIADRYYGSASAVPFSIFPRLLAGAKHHLSRLRKDKAGMAVNLDKDLGEIMIMLPETFPRHLSIDQQGRFAIGYYHQKQHYFAKKSPETSEE